MKNNPSDHIEQVINSLNGINRVEAPAFFYTRLLARMENVKSSVWTKISGVLSKPMVAFACIAIIAMINLFAVFYHNQPVTTNSQTDLIAIDEYSQVSNSYFEVENVKP